MRTRATTLVMCGVLCFGLIGGLSGYYQTRTNKKKSVAISVATFISADDFKAYLAQASTLSMGGVVSGGKRAGGFSTSTLIPSAAGNADLNTSSAIGAPQATSIDRYSSTNVQVVGIDEPDSLKTNGAQLFFSQQSSFAPIPYALPEKEFSMPGKSTPGAIGRPIQATSEVKVVGAQPATAPKLLSSIPTDGNLLLADGTLIALTDTDVTGYSVSNPEQPSKAWTHPFGDQTRLVDARLLGGKVYLILRTSVDTATPCPLRPLSGSDVEISCGAIFRPRGIVPVDATYQVLRVNPATGLIEGSMAFVGLSNTSTVYVSPNAVYLTTYDPGDVSVLQLNALLANATFLSTATQQQLVRLQSYTLSAQARSDEIESILEQASSSLSPDAQSGFWDKVTKAEQAYEKDHIRQIDSTDIVRVTLPDLKVTASGSVPGHLLSTYSLDEYQGSLRVAASLGVNGFAQQDTSLSDVTILKADDLKYQGSVRDIGKGQQLYAVRFEQQRGYLVTYRQVDPFTVLDLSNPAAPALKGQLDLPGYSSYLHPLTNSLILGIGRDTSSIKLTLFDVSNADAPKDVSTVQMGEYWSQAQDNPHAFLQDVAHQAFFLPGGKNSYVYSYAGGTLKQVATIAGTASRAAYVNNNFYIVGENSLTVLDENTWQQVGVLPL